MCLTKDVGSQERNALSSDLVSSILVFLSQYDDYYIHDYSINVTLLRITISCGTFLQLAFYSQWFNKRVSINEIVQISIHAFSCPKK